MEQWLDAAAKSMPAAKEPLNAFHWDTRRLVTNDDLVAQLRSAAISHEILHASKPHLEQVDFYASAVLLPVLDAQIA